MSIFKRARIQPEQARALTPEEANLAYQDTLSYNAMMDRHNRNTIKWAWCIGGAGVGVGLCGMVAAASLFPLKKIEVQYFLVERSTGWIGEAASPKDAPKLFGDLEQEAALQRYVELREGYVYETDQVSFNLAAAMSAPDEQRRYKALHDHERAPSRAMRDKGSVQVYNFRFSKLGDGKADTKAYVVRFKRREVTQGSPLPRVDEDVEATIHYQMLPDRPMTLPARRQNPTGLYVISYNATASQRGRGS